MDRERTTERDAGRFSYWGSAGLVLGAFIVCLAFADSTTGLPFNMPRSWYVNKPIWYSVALAGFVVGYRLLRNRPTDSDVWRPSVSGIRFDRVVLYTKSGCDLCDDAIETLLKYRQYLPETEEVDIHSDPELLNRFQTCIPVVEFDGKVRFHGKVDEPLLRRLIDGTPPKPRDR